MQSPTQAAEDSAWREYYLRLSDADASPAPVAPELVEQAIELLRLERIEDRKRGIVSTLPDPTNPDEVEDYFRRGKLGRAILKLLPPLSDEEVMEIMRKRREQLAAMGIPAGS